PSAASRSPADSLPFSTNFPRLFSIDLRARSTNGCATSTRRTLKPACAHTCAMPLPIVPAPTIPPVLLIHASFLYGLCGGGSGLCALGGSHPFDSDCDAVAATETQRRDAAFQVAVLQRVEQRRQHPAPARSDRVAERNRAAIDVDFRGIDAELVQHGDGLHRERFVQLEEVDSP